MVRPPQHTGDHTGSAEVLERRRGRHSDRLVGDLIGRLISIKAMKIGFEQVVALRLYLGMLSESSEKSINSGQLGIHAPYSEFNTLIWSYF